MRHMDRRSAIRAPFLGVVRGLDHRVLRLGRAHPLARTGRL